MGKFISISKIVFQAQKIQDKTVYIINNYFQERQEVLKSKSVSELSEIKSFSDLPVPATLQRMAKKGYYTLEHFLINIFCLSISSYSHLSINLSFKLSINLSF